MVSATTLMVTWDSPLMPNGNLTYTTTLSYTDLATGSSTNNVLTMVTPEGDRTVTYTGMIEPYAIYQATVIATTSAGDSTPATDSLLTPQGGTYNKLYVICLFLVYCTCTYICLVNYISVNILSCSH